MLHIDSIIGRKNYDNDDLVKIKVNKITDTSDWGDEDCTKMVSTVTDCEITFDKSIADDYKNVDRIEFYRKNYYKPAYSINAKNQTKVTNPDGSITFIAKA